MDQTLVMPSLEAAPRLLRGMSADATAEQAWMSPRPGDWLSAFFGPVTLGEYATHVEDHDLEHLAQLRAGRAAALAAG